MNIAEKLADMKQIEKDFDEFHIRIDEWEKNPGIPTKKKKEKRQKND